MAIRIQARAEQSVNELDDHAISLLGWLDGAEIVTAVTCTKASGPGSISGLGSGTISAGYTDAYTGEIVASGQAVQFRVSFDTKGVYTILVEITTSLGRTPKRDYVVRVV